MIDVIEQFRTAIHNAGLIPPEMIVADGRLHRFASNGKQGDDAGWYVFYDNGVPAGAFGCWRSGLSEAWRADIGRTLYPHEEAEHKQRIEKIRKAREAEDNRIKAEARIKASQIWENSK